MATGDQTLINFPREATMQKIATSLDAIAFSQAAKQEKHISTLIHAAHSAAQHYDILLYGKKFLIVNGLLFGKKQP